MGDEFFLKPLGRLDRGAEYALWCLQPADVKGVPVERIPRVATAIWDTKTIGFGAALDTQRDWGNFG